MNNLLKKPLFWIAVAAAVVLLALAAYFLSPASRPARPPAAESPAPAPTVALPAPAAKKEEEGTRFPLPESPLKLADKAEAEKDKANKLPPPDDSDSIMTALLNDLIGSKAFATFLQNSNLVRRLTAAIDNLPRERIAARLNPVKPIEGSLGTIGEGSTLALSPGNYQRYDAFVQFATSLDTARIVEAYIRYYPLFQKEYQSLGFPDKYFNDRVVEAIDDLLAAPELTEPVRLVQPKVRYQFADPALEGLSHGRKIMIRVGPVHAAQLKLKLREFRAAITRAQANRPKS